MTTGARRKHDWGTIYRLNLHRGYDHGYAAHAADEWELRNKRKLAKCHGTGRVVKEVEG